MVIIEAQPALRAGNRQLLRSRSATWTLVIRTIGVPLSRVAQTTTTRFADICCRYGSLTTVTGCSPIGRIVVSFFDAPGALVRYRAGDSTI